MNKRVYRQDIIAGIAVILIGIISFILTLSMPGKAPIFPRLISAAFLVFGILLAVTSYTKLKKDVPTEEKVSELKDFKYPVIVFALLILYVLAVVNIGFYIATPIMLVCYMWFMGIRKIRTILITTVIVMAFVYILFTMQLKVPLPKGILG